MMGIEEIIFNVLLSLLTNGITTLADRYDDKDKKAFDDLKEKLRNQDILQIITCESLKEIKVNEKEVNKLKVFVIDDIFKNKLAEILTKPSPENDTIQLIISEVKKHCNLPEDKPLSIEPYINQFVNAFYKRILETPALAPFLIIKGIEESRRALQKEHKAIFDSVNSLHTKVDQLAANTARDIPIQSIDTKQALSNRTPIGQPQEEKRLSLFLDNESRKMLSNTLSQLNNLFKSRAEDIKQIQKKRDFRKATELYESLLKDTNNIDTDTILGIYVDYALCSINLDEFDVAKEWLDKAEVIEPNDKRIFALRGLLFYELGDKNMSMEFAEKSLESDQFYHLALILIAAIELEAGTTGQSILQKYFFDKNNNLKSGFKKEHLPVIYRTIGQCCLKDNAFDDAITYFQRSLKLDESDDATLSLIGLAYLRKVTGAKSNVVHFYEKLDETKEVFIRKAIEYFNEALEAAARYKNIKHHMTTRANLSMCYMLLGLYDNAYEIAKLSITYFTESSDLLKSMATAAFYKGSYAEAAELLLKVPDINCQDIINEALALLYSEKSGKEQEAIDLLDQFLSKETVTNEDIGQINYLKFEILLALKEKEKAASILNLFDAEVIPEWQKEASKGHYYATFGEHEQADKHFKIALSKDDIKTPTKIYIAEYYYKRKDFKSCFEICKSIPFEQIKAETEIFKTFLFVAVVSSFKLSQYDECLKYIAYGKKCNLEDVYLYDIAASAYWHLDNLESARKELQLVRDKQKDKPNVYVLTNLSAISVMLGDLKSVLNYIEQAESLPDFYIDSQDVINCITSLIVIGNRVEAWRIFNKCVELRFENKDDLIHKFAPFLYLRERKSELFAEYAVEFNKRHGDTKWLWKKDLRKDEIIGTFSEISNRWNEIKAIYLNSPLPLVFLPLLTLKNEIMHYWKFNREYELPLFLESGNPQKLEEEISLLEKSKSILIDYTVLLTIKDAGTEYFWILDKLFDEIYIYRPSYLQILNDLVAEEHQELRDIINYITSSNKIKFINKVNLPDTEAQSNEVFRRIPSAYTELFYLSKNRQMHMLLGEKRLRTFAHHIGTKSSGIRALFEYAKKEQLIDESDISKVIVNFVSKECQFISFNHNTVDYLFKHYGGEELKSIFNKLSNQIHLPHSEIKTFFNVYLGAIQQHLQSDVHEPIKYLIEKTITDAKKITSRTLSFVAFPYLNKNAYPTDIKMITESFGYIYELYRLVNSSNISDQLKAEYIDIIRKNANLAYWYESTYKDVPVIQLLYRD